MPDSLPMLAEITEAIEALPTTGAGFRVENPSEFAIAIVGIVAPAYQADIDIIEGQRTTAQSLADQRNAELMLLRGEVDQLREVTAGVKAAVDNGDLVTAAALLATIG